MLPRCNLDSQLRQWGWGGVGWDGVVEVVEDKAISVHPTELNYVIKVRLVMYL